jgi:hypothetical protein
MLTGALFFVKYSDFDARDIDVKKTRFDLWDQPCS